MRATLSGTCHGSRKWHVDGNEYVDYLGGHGALTLGHSYPAVVEAVTAQAAKGAHYGACHALEAQWAELVRSLIPSAQRVRFTVTGTEATHLWRSACRARNVNHHRRHGRAVCLQRRSLRVFRPTDETS